MGQLSEHALQHLFEVGRTHNVWLEREVPAALLRSLYERLRWAPTSANCNPGRFVFVRSPQAKERLGRRLSPQNLEKTMSAPVCVARGGRRACTTTTCRRFQAAASFRTLFASAPALADETATRRNAILQGYYLILAARSFGLDCGPMSGFDRQGVDAEFFPDGRWQSNFLVNLGYGDKSKLWPRNPRLAFDEACQIL